MQNYKMIIAYDGRKYMGFSIKKDNPEKSVQGKLEMILEKLYEVEVEVTGAVSTDAGVHAKGQVVNFLAFDDRLTTAELHAYFEKYLPDDIIVVSLEEADDRFHARYQMQTATYEYRLWKMDAPTRPLFERQYVNVMEQKLEAPKMNKAAKAFLGEHDFTPFTTNKKAKNPIKIVTAISVVETSHEIIITITANGFLLNMERLIVGTLVQVGLGQLPIPTVERAFTSQKMANVGHKAMAGALCLLSVAYDAADSDSEYEA